MKFFLTLFAVLATALPSMAADRKKAPEKEIPLTRFELTIEGVPDANAQASVKTALAAMKDVKVDTFETGEKECKAVLSTKSRLSRGDVGKALKDQKGAKITGFKTVRPDKDKDKDKKDDGKEKEKEKTKEKTKSAD